MIINNILSSRKRYKSDMIDKWKYYSIPLERVLDNKIDNNFEEFLSLLEENKIYILLLKADSNGEWITLNKKILIEKNNYSSIELLNEIKQGMNYHCNDYDFNVVLEINLCYTEYLENYKKNEIKEIINKFNNKDKKMRIEADIRSEYLSEKYFPFRFEEKYFGECISEKLDENGNIVKLFRFTKNVLLERTSYSSTSSFVNVIVNNKLLFSFQDLIIDEKSFKRTIKKLDIFFDNNGKHLFTEKLKEFKFIPPLKGDTKYSDEIITLDIETFLENNIHVPYLIGYYAGNNILKTFYLTDYKNPQEMIIKCFQDLLNKNNRNKVVYIHNLGKFDGVFLLNYLHSEFKIKPIIKDNKILAITISTIPNSIDLKLKKVPNVTIYLHDSYLLLNENLRDLSTFFNTHNKKGIFPHKFVNRNNLNYIGKIPDIAPTENMESVSLKTWDLKKEALCYLEKDLKSLYEVISNFQKYIFETYSLDIKNYITLSSLAFAIFRFSFFGNAKDKLPILHKQSNYHKIVKSSYYGGSVDIYKPYLNNGYYYDMNSLYPYAMLQPLPVGNGTYSTDPNLDNWFGFIKVKVNCPDDLKIPILPFHKEDGTVIHPTGTWTATYFSEELKNAMKLGYTFKIIEGVKFEKGIDIFKDYVEHFYKFKSESSGFQQKISKILLNSLYGRMGMSLDSTEIVLVNHDEAQHLILNHEILYHEVLDDGLEIIKYLKFVKPSFFQKDYHDNGLSFNFKTMNINIQSYKIKEFYAINPKAYTYFNDKGEIISKIAGVNHQLNIQDCHKLMTGDFLTINFERWYRNLSKGEILVKSQQFLLRPNHSKRLAIYDINGVWVDTKPFKLIDGNILVEQPSFYSSYT